MSEATDRVQIFMLGKFELRRNGAAIPEQDWIRKTNRQLLKFFLTQRNQPLTLDHMIEVLYPDNPSMALARNLLGRISDLRRILEPRLESGNQSRFILRVNQGTYLFAADAPCDIDVDAFTAAVSKGDAAFGRGEWREALAAYTKATRLYRGDFLEEDRDQAWTIATRDRMRALARHAWLNAGRCRMSLHDFSGAAEAFERAAASDPLDKEARCGKALAYYHSGDEASARAAIGDLLDALEAGGLKADEETIALAEAIRGGTLPKPAPETPHNLFRPATPLFGRQREIARIREALQEPDARVVTLVGPGGIGKTRLAVEIGLMQLPHFPDGVFYVDLADGSAAERTAHAIARSAGISFDGTADVDLQLIRALSGRSVLVILDNCDVLNGEWGLLARIASEAGARLLAAGRAPLGMNGERVVDVRGLSHPEEPSDSLDAAALWAYSSVLLLIDRLRRVDHTFTLDNEAAPFVARICRMTFGVPLALELAASWGRLLTCREIADEIEASVIRWRTPEAAPENSGLRAVFDLAWSHLTEEERTALGRLATAIAPMTAQEVAEIAGPSVTVSLRGKALLHRASPDRFRVHEQLRELILERSLHDRAPRS